MEAFFVVSKMAFWTFTVGVLYAYFGYPLVLAIWGRWSSWRRLAGDPGYTPTVTVVIPAHNEEAVIREKVENTLSLDYPPDRVRVIIVSDGSTDGTARIVSEYLGDLRLELLESSERKGKANALNMALRLAKSEIVVFSDSSIVLDHGALREVVNGFQDEAVGCVSGEDYIPDGGGEGLYGRYELFLRNQESKVSSIAGASGSFYAQRRTLCRPFPEGVAPDFLSVLNTVEQGYRAITEPRAFGTMSAVGSVDQELQRKVRTLLRGMSTLWYKKNLLNPWHFGRYAFVLISHKVFRWLVPLFLLGMLASNILLAGSSFYGVVLVVQLAFYSLALLAWGGMSNLEDSLYGRIPLYFVTVNIAIILAGGRFLRGARQEIWEPSKRVAKDG